MAAAEMAAPLGPPIPQALSDVLAGSMGPPPVRPAATAAEEAAPAAAVPTAEQGLPYPGSFELLHSEYKSVSTVQNLIDGATLMVQNPIGQSLRIEHKFELSNGDKPSVYHFNAMYVGATKMGPGAQYPVLLGDKCTDGRFHSMILHKWSPSLATKLQMESYGPNWAGALEVDYSGADYHAGARLTNPSLDGSGMLSLHYMQSITRRLALGAEWTCHREMPSQGSVLGFAAKYKADKWIATGSVMASGSLSASYVHEVAEKVMVGTELEVDMGMGESVGAVAAQFNFRQSTFRAQADTKGVVSAVLEQHMAPGVSFILSGVVDHAKGQNRFGLGLLIAPG